MSMVYSLHEICKRLAVPCEDLEDIQISGTNALSLARSGEITFAESQRMANQVTASEASVVIVPTDFPQVAGPLLMRTDNPRGLFVRVMELFLPIQRPWGIHERAIIDPTARLGEQVSVGACAVIGAETRIGSRTFIESGVSIGSDVQISEDCYIEANVCIRQGVRIGSRVIIHAGTVIGGDGFGYVWMQDHHHKIPQVGIVVIEDDVEIGCNTCIDRAAFGVTRIGRGTKIDNLVQVAHNNDIGEHVILVSQVGVAGSVTIGKGAMLGGQSGVAGHLRIGEGARIGAKSGVTCNIEAGQNILGMPSRPTKRVLKEQASLAKVPDMIKAHKTQAEEIETLKARLEELESRLK